MVKTCQRGLHQYEGRRCQECAKSRSKEYSRTYHKANAEREKGVKAAWYKANAERERVRAAAWKRANAERVKAQAAVRYEANKERVKERTATWRSLNPARAKAAVDAWHAANPEKVRELASRRRARRLGNLGNEPVTKAHLVMLLEAQDNACRYCRAPLAVNPRTGLPFGKAAHMDHRMPIKRGGPHAPHNLCWACPSCNLRKNVKTEAEFLTERAA